MINDGGDFSLGSMALYNLSISAASATVGARLYDATTMALVASADATVASGADQTVSVPIQESAQCSRGEEYPHNQPIH